MRARCRASLQPGRVTFSQGIGRDTDTNDGKVDAGAMQGDVPCGAGLASSRHLCPGRAFLFSHAVARLCPGRDVLCSHAFAYDAYDATVARDSGRDTKHFRASCTAAGASSSSPSSSKRKLESTMTLEGAARAPAWVGTIAAGAAAFALGWLASARRASNAHTFADSNQLLALIKARRSIFPKVSRLVNPAP